MNRGKSRSCKVHVKYGICATPSESSTNNPDLDILEFGHRMAFKRIPCSTVASMSNLTALHRKFRGPGKTLAGTRKKFTSGPINPKGQWDLLIEPAHALLSFIGSGINSQGLTGPFIL